MLASTLFQQSPAQPHYSQTGNWEYLTASTDYRVRWRNDILSSPYQDPKSSYNGGDRIDIYDTYGIHAAVLPTKVYFPNLDPVGVRGTVMLWGNGTGYTFPEPPINDPRTYNYSYSSFLLWNPLLHGNGSADRLLFGFVGYTKDPDTTTTSVRYMDVANIFCSGHSFMPDGKLCVSGGSHYWKENATAPTEVHGTRACYLFDSAQWRNADGQPAHNGWSLPLGPYGSHPSQRIGMGVRRWYPSTLLLPDKKMLIAGGTTQAEANRLCTHPDGLNTTYQIYDPDANAFSTYNLNVVGGCDGHAAWYNFDEADQRFTLGNEYPRLHGATWATGSPPNQTLHYRAVYAGPDSRVYLFDPAAPSSGWALRSVAPGSAFDNVVDAEEMFRIAAAGQYAQDDKRDLNKDGWIDAADLTIALWNLGRQGD
ncbi:MAG: hypothetical protein HUU60_02490 [Armatimonadetes bacterium]|nr:hypothetical protein [Armatimonadota bacterium]